MLDFEKPLSTNNPPSNLYSLSPKANNPVLMPSISFWI